MKFFILFSATKKWSRSVSSIS